MRNRDQGLGYQGAGAPDIRELGPTGYPGYLTGRDIRDIRIRDEGIRFSP
jgi:hypothetical protein